ncbi:hypothetical protein LCGC14_1043130, partial [marine sediment metagenome]
EHIITHPLIADWTGWVVPDFDAALEVVGFVLGPYVGLHDGEQILHFAEFGVVMLLFVIGLELRPIR